MSNRKGLYDDDDKFTLRHNEICHWFVLNTINTHRLIRSYLFDVPQTLQTPALEEPLTAPNGFLLGHPDVLIDYETDQKKPEQLLVEVKSSISDLTAALRQIKTYRKNLPKVTKTILVYEECNPQIAASLRTIIGSQGIYVFSFKDLHKDYSFGETNPGFFEWLEKENVPAGRRPAKLWLAYKFDDPDCLQGFSFWVYTSDGKSEFAYDAGDYRGQEPAFQNILQAFGAKLIEPDGVTNMDETDKNYPCEVDLEYLPDLKGRPQPFLRNLYVNGNTIPLIQPKRRS